MEESNFFRDLDFLNLEDECCLKKKLAPRNSRDLNILILKMGVVSKQRGREAPERKFFAFSELKLNDFVHILGGIF